MKTSIFLLVSFILPSSHVNVNNSLAEGCVKGKVKSITRYILSRKGEYVEMDVSTYDECGNVILQRIHHRDTGLVFPTFVSDYKYNAKGDKIEENIYNGDGSLSWKTLFTYDENDLLMETYRYPLSGILMQKDIYKYDSTGKRIEYWSYDGKGRNNGKSIYKYDEQNNLIQEQEEDYGSMGDLTKVSRRYDNHNDLIEYTETEILEVDGNRKSFQRNNKSCYTEYDDNGNWTNMIETLSSEGVTDTINYRREISYYQPTK